MVLMHISEKNTLKNLPDISSMVVERLSYFHLMNFFHIHQLTCMSSSISFFMVLKKNQKQSVVLNDGDVLCSVPLNILAPKLTLKTAKELANLHDMYMPSKILLKNAQILLENHKCEFVKSFSLC